MVSRDAQGTPEAERGDVTGHETQDQDVQGTAPNWATESKDLLCPLCGYNLRGLSEPRCPECGFKFTWRELIDSEKNRHPYLFEYGKGRNLATFWNTFWRTCRPRRFWNEVNPAQEVRPFRLIIYWALSNFFVLGIVVVPIFNLASTNLSIRSTFLPAPGKPGFLQDRSQFSYIGPITQEQLHIFAPAPWNLNFWFELFKNRQTSRYGFELDGMILAYGGIYVIWPWLTLVSLMVFRISMRQAKIRTVHLVRTVIYSCDFVMLLSLVSVVAHSTSDFTDGWFAMVVAAVCGVITTYRLTIAFRQYLRVHLPLATVVASQIIVFLAIFSALVLIGMDFSRRV